MSLYLKIAAEEAAKRKVVLIAGSPERPAPRARANSRLLGHHAACLAGAMKGASIDVAVRHCAAVAARSRSSASTSSRRSAARVPSYVLAPLRQDRERGSDQDRAVQPLPHARRD